MGADVEPSRRAEDPPRLPGYAIDSVIGAGGFGTVFRGRRLRDDTAVAIKIAREDQTLPAARFFNEAAALLAIGPPTVPLLHETMSLPDGRAVLVMELISAPTLAARLAELGGPMDRREFAAVAAPLVAAVGAAHQRGFLHRDLKPENVFVETELARVRICDFGLVKGIGTVTTLRTDLTSEGTVAGSAEYLSPEQCEGNPDLDERADIYSLGVILYELATGRIPFVARSASELRRAHLSRRPQPPSELSAISPNLEAVILRCLAKDRTQRFVSAGALAAALGQALADDGEWPAAAGTPAPAAMATRTRHSRRQMALLYLRSDHALDLLQREVSALGGQIPSIKSPRYVAVFDAGSAASPLQRALNAAQELCARGRCRRVLVDIASVIVLSDCAGGPRHISSAFERDDRFAIEDAPTGVLLTPAAAASSSHTHTVPAFGRPDLRALAITVDAAGATLVHSTHVPLVGRGRLLDEILASAAAAERSCPSLATVIAEPGHGKSHFAAVLTQRLREQHPDAQVQQLRAREHVAGDGDDTLRALLRAALGSAPDESAEEGRRRLPERAGRELAGEFALVFGLILGWVSADEPAVRSLRSAPGVLRSLAARAVGEMLRRRAAAASLFLVVDDAHFADQTSLDALEYATLAETTLPIWVCVLGRPAFDHQRRFWGDRAGASARHELGVLDEQTAAELCRTLLKPAELVPSSVIARLVERTRGIPLLLVELVAGLKREGLVRRHAYGNSWFLVGDAVERLPDLPMVDWLAERELGGMPGDLAAYAQLAALLGAEFTTPELAGVLDEIERAGEGHSFPLDCGDSLRRLLTARLLVEHRRGRLTFRHALVREAVARAIPEEQRQRIHVAAYRFYRDRWVAAKKERLPKLAFHASRSGRRREAADAFLELADAARVRHDYCDAELLFNHALGELDDEDVARRLAAVRRRGEMRYRIGRYGDALQDLENARRLADQLGDVEARIEVLLEEATVLDWVDEYARSRSIVEEALALSSTACAASLTARLLMSRGRTLWRFCEWDNARQYLAEAVACAEQLGDDGYETHVESLAMLGEVLCYSGRVDEAERTFDRLVTLSKQHEDWLHWAVALNNRRAIWIARKKPERVIDDMNLCMQLSREGGLMALEFFAQFNLAETLYQIESSDAAEHVERAIELQRRRVGEGPRALAMLLKARLLARQGNDVAARAVLDDIRAAQARRAGESLIPSEDVLLTMVDLATRDASDAEWEALQIRSRQFSVEQEGIEVIEMRGLAALRRGRIADGRRWQAEALRLAATTPNILESRIRRAAP